MTRVADRQPGPSTAGADRLLDALARWSAEQGATTAVDAADGRLTFAELADATAAIATALAAAGIVAGRPVGLLTGRSRFGLPGLLAVWRLGATAVLVDERHPVDRVHAILRDAGTDVLLAVGGTPPGVTPAKARVLDPSAVCVPEAHPAARAAPLAAVESAGCAYLVYTSGTTGWPKGIEVSYENLATFLTALATLELPPGGTGVNLVSPAFDGWLWCTLLYLLNGQTMALIDLASRGAAVGLSDLIEAHAPTTVCLTPTLLSALERAPQAEVVVVAGEPCPSKLLQRLVDVPRVLNVYGPTETTIAATWADSAAGDPLTTIGRPLPGYAVYLLDDDGLPVPDGVVGELYIGGQAVARGYRNRPGLTSDRFLADPFAGGDARMYRSGDLARRLPGGQLDFQGRADEQVKVRGFRVELGEIEQVALAVTDVASAAAFTLPPGESLCLAVTMQGADEQACVAEVRQRCRDLLPDFMVPATVSVVEVLPALPTGKIDRVALGLAARDRLGGRPPATEREHQVCAVFGEFLGHPVTDVDADFFELGGHSLLAARVVGSLRRSTGLSVPVQHLLANPTAAGLATAIDELAATTSPA